MNEVTVIQQVNLLDKRFREEEALLSTKRIINIWMILIGVFTLHSFYTYYETTRLENDAAALKEQHDVVALRLEQVTKTVQPGESSQLENEIAQLVREREEKIRIRNALTGTDLGNTAGFSAHLEGLARQVIPKIWLTGIHIDEGGKNLGIFGSAMDAEIVPRYLQNLSSEDAFSGSDFRSFIMQRPEVEGDDVTQSAKDKKEKKKLAPQIDFVIQTSQAVEE